MCHLGRRVAASKFGATLDLPGHFLTSLNEGGVVITLRLVVFYTYNRDANILALSSIAWGRSQKTDSGWLCVLLWCVYCRFIMCRQRMSVWIFRIRARRYNITIVDISECSIIEIDRFDNTIFMHHGIIRYLRKFWWFFDGPSYIVNDPPGVNMELGSHEA